MKRRSFLGALVAAAMPAVPGGCMPAPALAAPAVFDLAAMKRALVEMTGPSAAQGNYVVYLHPDLKDDWEEFTRIEGGVAGITPIYQGDLVSLNA